jgi:uncharacterized protein (TIGR00369 family)
MDHGALTLPEGYARCDVGTGFSIELGDVFLDLVKARLAFRVTEKQCNPFGVCHGGAMATFADAQILAVRGGPVIADRHTPTISLSVDYLRPAALGSLVEAAVTLLRATGTVIFTQALISVDDVLVARSSAVYRNSRKDPSS